MRVPPVCVALLVLPGLASAQVLRGSVVDGSTGAPVSFVAVSLLANDSTVVATALTRPSGEFRLSAPKKGSYLIRAEALGYATATAGPHIFEEGHTLTVSIRLAIDAVLLDRLVVASSIKSLRQRDLWEYERRVQRYGHLLDVRLFPREALKERDGWTLEEFMRRAAPRIGTPGQDCEPVVFVNAKQTIVDMQQPVGAFEGIEFYRGIGPPGSTFINPDACGVILIWTRMYFTERYP